MPGSQTAQRSTGESRSIRVSGRTHVVLGDLAAQLGVPMQDVVDKAVEQFRRQQLREASSRAYAALRQDPDAWAEFQAERAVWEQTLSDGLR